MKIIETEEDNAKIAMSKFGFGDEELEDIFDIIANEHPEL